MFTETERKIFQVDTDPAPRFADPIVVWRRILESLGGDELDGVLAEVKCEAASLRLNGMKRLAEISRDAFDLQPLQGDGSGYSESEAMAILYRFFEWENDLKKTSESTESSSSLSDFPAT